MNTDIQMSKLVGFEKITTVLNILKTHPEYEWILFAECDTMITNFKTKLESLIDNNYHFIVAMDINDINAGVFMVRNTLQGIDYLEMIRDAKPRYVDNWQGEQAVIQDTWKLWNHVVKVVPQRTFNSFDYSLHPDHLVWNDKLGFSGHWQQGDFILHLPAKNQDQRIYYFSQVIPLIVK